MLLHPSRSLHVSSHNLGSIPFNSIWPASDFFRYLTDIFAQVEEKFLSNMFSSHEMGIISFLAHQINSNNASKHLLVMAFQRWNFLQIFSDLVANLPFFLLLRLTHQRTESFKVFFLSFCIFFLILTL